MVEDLIEEGAGALTGGGEIHEGVVAAVAG